MLLACTGHTPAEAFDHARVGTPTLLVVEALVGNGIQICSTQSVHHAQNHAQG